MLAQDELRGVGVPREGEHLGFLSVREEGAGTGPLCVTEGCM